MWELACLR